MHNKNYYTFYSTSYWQKKVRFSLQSLALKLPEVSMTAHSSELALDSMEISYDMLIGKLDASAQLFSLWRWFTHNSLFLGAFCRKISSCRSFLIDAKWAPYKYNIRVSVKNSFFYLIQAFFSRFFPSKGLCKKLWAGSNGGIGFLRKLNIGLFSLYV